MDTSTSIYIELEKSVEQESKELSQLRQVELFQGMDAAELQVIAQEMTERSYVDGEVVFRREERAESGR